MKLAIRKMVKKVPKENKYYSMKNLANNEGEINLFGVIREGSWWSEDSTTSANGFRKALEGLGNVSKIYVNINSIGGAVYEGQAIYSMLKRHTATIHVRVEGIAASIASVIAMAGDVIEIPKNAQLMIHNPTDGVYGGIKDFERGITRLETATESIVATYHEKTGIDVEELKNLMAEETWYTGQEAYDAGFATVVSDTVDMSACMSSDMELLNRYKNVPENMFESPIQPMNQQSQQNEINYDLLAQKVAEKMNNQQVPQQKNTEKKKNSLRNALKALNM